MSFVNTSDNVIFLKIKKSYFVRTYCHQSVNCDHSNSRFFQGENFGFEDICSNVSFTGDTSIGQLKLLLWGQIRRIGQELKILGRELVIRFQVHF